MANTVTWSQTQENDPEWTPKGGKSQYSADIHHRNHAENYTI